MKKTSKHFHPLIISRRLIGVFVAVTAVVATRWAYPQPVPTYHLTLTENSSTNLSLTYDGPLGASAFTVTPGAVRTDTWLITSNSTNITFETMFSAHWQEPEDATGTNLNQVFGSNDRTLAVSSDLFFALGTVIVTPNNMTAPGFGDLMTVARLPETLI